MRVMLYVIKLSANLTLSKVMQPKLDSFPSVELKNFLVLKNFYCKKINTIVCHKETRNSRNQHIVCILICPIKIIKYLVAVEDQFYHCQYYQSDISLYSALAPLAGLLAPEVHEVNNFPGVAVTFLRKANTLFILIFAAIRGRTSLAGLRNEKYC